MIVTGWGNTKRNPFLNLYNNYKGPSSRQRMLLATVTTHDISDYNNISDAADIWEHILQRWNTTLYIMITNPFLLLVKSLEIKPRLTEEIKRRAIIVSLTEKYSNLETVAFVKLAGSFVYNPFGMSNAYYASSRGACGIFFLAPLINKSNICLF